MACGIRFLCKRVFSAMLTSIDCDDCDADLGKILCQSQRSSIQSPGGYTTRCRES